MRERECVCEGDKERKRGKVREREFIVAIA